MAKIEPEPYGLPPAETGRFTHLVPDFNFKGDNDATIMKMSREEICKQIKTNNLAVKRMSEYTAKLYSRDLGLQSEEWRKKFLNAEIELKNVRMDYSSMMALWSCYSGAMTRFKRDLQEAVGSFDEQSTPIIGDGVIVGEQGHIYNLPDFVQVSEVIDNFKKRRTKKIERKGDEEQDDGDVETTDNESQPLLDTDGENDKSEQKVSASLLLARKDLRTLLEAEMEKQRQEQKQTEENDNDSTTIGEEVSKQDDNSEPMQHSDRLQQDASPMPATADFQKILEISQFRKNEKKGVAVRKRTKHQISDTYDVEKVH